MFLVSRFVLGMGIPFALSGNFMESTGIATVDEVLIGLLSRRLATYRRIGLPQRASGINFRLQRQLARTTHHG